MKTIKSVDRYTFAKFVGVYNLIITLIIGIVLMIVFLVGLKSSPVYGASQGVKFFFLVIVILPVFSGFISFLFGLLTAHIYNRISKKYGGIKIDIE